MTKPLIQDMKDHKTNWEEEFDKEVSELKNDLDFNIRSGETNTHKFGYRYRTENNEVFTVTDWGNIKTFIKQTLYTTLTDLISKLEGEKIENRFPPQVWQNLGGESFNSGLGKSKQIVEEFIRDLSK